MPPGDILWVQVMANGGWDQAMFSDPKYGALPGGFTGQREDDRRIRPQSGDRA